MGIMKKIPTALKLLKTKSFTEKYKIFGLNINKKKIISIEIDV